MKTYYCVVLFIILLVMVSIVSADEVLITSSGRVNVRKLPDVNSVAIGKADPGMSYPYLGIADNGWFHIQLEDGIEGYISGKMGRLFKDNKNGEENEERNTESKQSNKNELTDTEILNSNKEEVSLDQKSEQMYSLVEYGYSFVNHRVIIAGIIHNNTKDKVITFPEFRATIRDSSGKILAVTKLLGECIYPNHDQGFECVSSVLEEMPNVIEIDYIAPKPLNIMNVMDVKHPEYVPIEVKDARIKKERFSASLLGELYNPNNFDIEQCRIIVIFRNDEGKIECGESRMMYETISANSTLPFEMRLLHPERMTNDFEVYVELSILEV